MRSRKEQWLLALLVLRNGREVQREWLAETLWPDSRIEQSQAYLRQSLYVLKKALGGHGARLNSPTARSLRLDLGGADIDVIAFDSAVAHDDVVSLRRAISLYSGPLLEGCTEPWAESEQRAREQSWLLALGRLAEIEHAAGRLQEARSLLARLLSHDPLRESAHRALMQTLADDGDFAAVTTTYRDLRLLLRREVNADPSPESVALYEKLSALGRRPGTPTAPGHVRVDSPAESAAARSGDNSYRAAPAVGTTGPPSPPRPLTSLIGRSELIREVTGTLGRARLVTLIGPGGAGKTRIAIEVAEQWRLNGPIWFAELAAIADPALLAETVMVSLGAAEAAETSAAESLVRFIGERPALLVLDNCEHLLDEAGGLGALLLRRCPALRLLATSRQALGIAGEALFPVPPLDMPPASARWEDENQLHILQGYAAICLFAERAAAVTPAFRLTTRNATAVAEICRDLDGTPLAIELAAAWISVLTPQQIHARLVERRFELLVSRRRDMDERHRSLWAVIDGSSSLLSPDLRTFLAGLSIFRGGWTLEEADSVCGAPPAGAGPEHEQTTLERLALLQERSLVQSVAADGAMRYLLLESVHAYAAEQLTPEEHLRLREAHAAAYTQLAERASHFLIGPDQAHWLNRLEEEKHNMRAALGWCAANDAGLARGMTLCAALWRFWDVRGHHRDGLEWAAGFMGRDQDADPALRAQLREAAGQLSAGIQNSNNAYQWTAEALALFTDLGDAAGIARCLCTLGTCATNLGRVEEARTRLAACLRMLEGSSDLYERGRALSGMGMLEEFTGASEEARALLQRCAEEYRRCGHLRGVALTHYRLGGIAMLHEQFGRAEELFQQALTLAREIDDRTTLPFGHFHLGRCCMLRGDLREANSYLVQGVECARAVGNGVVEGTCLLLRGDIAAQTGEPGSACALYLAALRAYSRPDLVNAMAVLGARVATAAIRHGHVAEALMLHAFAACRVPPRRRLEERGAFLLYMSLGYIFIDHDQYEADMETLRCALADQFDAIRTEGESMSAPDAHDVIARLAAELAALPPG